MRRIAPGMCLIVTCFALAAVLAEDEPEKEVADKTSASRLRAVREIMQQISMESTEEEPKPLELKPDPILRYNDVTRGIADSLVFRVGTQGRPLALISAELYGRKEDTFLLNHEFVALSDPKLRMRRDSFLWEPTEGTLKFEELPDAERPSESPPLRLTQMRRLADKFTATQTFRKSDIVLRRLAAPLDRYEPSERPRADGAAFAFVWGVNPEAVLFLESDGEKWSYGWAPLSSAPLEAKLENRVVWKRTGSPYEHRTVGYTSIHRSFTVPDYFDDPVADAEAKKP